MNGQFHVAQCDPAGAVTDLGSVPGVTGSQANGINERGMASGNSSTATWCNPWLWLPPTPNPGVGPRTASEGVVAR